MARRRLRDKRLAREILWRRVMGLVVGGGGGAVAVEVGVVVVVVGAPSVVVVVAAAVDETVKNLKT